MVGRIADRGAEFVAAREWMRICFELLEMLKAHKKAIRRAAVNTFGYIAKAIGPQDVLHTLLNNLKVQERQNRVCTTVAIGIVAETCAPFTVLPALLNEYRVPELNVQNGVLKALSFMFEYIGEMGKDYLCCDTLARRRAHGPRSGAPPDCMCCSQTSDAGRGRFKLRGRAPAPHELRLAEHLRDLSARHCERLRGHRGLRGGLGPGYVLNYVLQGLYHPARRVREVYWKIYNTLYIYGADALTQYYPALESDETNSYQRTYMACSFRVLRTIFRLGTTRQSYEHGVYIRQYAQRASHHIVGVLTAPPPTTASSSSPSLSGLRRRAPMPRAAPRPTTVACTSSRTI